MSRQPFTKLGNSRLKSWHLSLYHNQRIVPDAINQGPYPTCVYHSHTKGGQMSVHRAFAKARKPCDIVMHGSSMIKDVLVLNKMRNGDVWLENPMADCYFQRIKIASWILKTLGVEATSDRWDISRIAVSDVEFLGRIIKFDDLESRIDDGKPVLAVMIAGPDICKLGGDEIYTCSRKVKYDDNGKLQKPHEYHMIVLVGTGEQEVTGRKLVAFLNSHGDDFGKDGCGWLYFDEVKRFYCVESLYPPIIKPNLRPRRPAATTVRKFIDEGKWRPEGSSQRVEQSQRSGRADSASNWRSQKDGDTSNAINGTNYFTVLKDAIRTESNLLMDPEINRRHVKQGISMAVYSVMQNLRGMARRINNTSEGIIQVAAHASNGQAEIGELILNALNEVGKDGFLTVMDGNDKSNEIKVASGLKLVRGHITPFFITNQKNKRYELRNPLVLVCDKFLPRLHAEKVWRIADKMRRNLLIITAEIEAEALTLLLDYKFYSISKVCVVKVPGSGDTREVNLKSISSFTGAKILREMDDVELINFPMLGKCDMVTTSKNECVLVDGIEDNSNIETTAQLMGNLTRESTDSCLKIIQGQINRLCRVGILKIGGTSREEIDRNKARVTVAVTATKSALEAGVVPGNGLAYLVASNDLCKLETKNTGQKIGVQIIQNALKVPAYTIASIAGPDAPTFDMLLAAWEAGCIEPCELVMTELEAAEVDSSTIFLP